jgi:putative transposase
MPGPCVGRAPPVGAGTYRAWRQANLPVAARTLGDAVVIDALLATRRTPEGSTGGGR